MPFFCTHLDLYSSRHENNMLESSCFSPVFTFLLLHYNAYGLSMKSTTGIRSWRVSSCKTPAFYQGCNFVVKLLSVDERIATSTDAKPPP